MKTATTPQGFGAIPCSRWRSTVRPRTVRCVRSPPSRAWRTCRTCDPCCGWVRRWSTCPAVAAGEGGPLIVLPGNAPRYGGQQGREADMTELLATGEQTGGSTRPVSPNHRPWQRAAHASARNGSRVCLRRERPVQLQAWRTCGERTTRLLYLHPSQDPAHLQECRHGAGCVAVRCDTWRARDDVRGAAGCGCGNEQEADANASRGSRGATAPVAPTHMAWRCPMTKTLLLPLALILGLMSSAVE